VKSLQHCVTGLDLLVSARLGGCPVELHPIPGSVPVVQVSIGGREELPIFVSASDAQLLCICYLWTEDEVLPERRTELLEALLDLNLPVPLSSFSRVGDHYVLFGALGREARVEDIAEDVATLSDNALDALEALAEFLK